MEISLYVIKVLITWFGTAGTILGFTFLWFCWPINDKETTKGQYYFWAGFNIVGNVIALAIFNDWIRFTP